MGRVPLRLIRLVYHQHFDSWIAAKDAVHQALAPEECARELWLVDAPLELVREERAATSFLQQLRRHRQASKPQHTFTGQRNLNSSGTAASQQIRQYAAESKKQSHSAETSPSDAEHSKDCPLDQAVHVKLSQQTVRQPSDSLPLWWRHVHQNVPLVFLAPHEAGLAGLRVNRMGHGIWALLDTGASHSFVSPLLLDELQLQTKPPQESTSSTLASDWLRRLCAVWDFNHDQIAVLRGRGPFNLSAAEMTAFDLQERLAQAETDTVRAEGQEEHADLLESLNQLGPQASALPTPEAACGGPRIPRALSLSLAADLARQTNTRLKNG
ncbi:hypothetical protein Esti_004793 [Eimeria stiedai]